MGEIIKGKGIKKQTMIQYGNIRSVVNTGDHFTNGTKPKNYTGRKNVKVLDDDAKMSKEAFFTKIERAEQSIKEGKGITVRTKQELLAHLDSL